MASITEKLTLVANPHTKRASSVALSYDKRSNRLIYPVGKTVVLRSLDSQTHWVYKGHKANVSVAKVSPTGFYVASGDESGWVQIWDCSQPEMILKSEFQVLAGKINDLVWDSESKRIIAVGHGSDKFGHAFSFDTGNSIGEISGHSATINTVDIRQVRPFRAVTGGDDSNIVFYQGPPFKFTASEKTTHSNFIKGVKFSPDGKYIVSVGVDRIIGVYDGKEGNKLKTLEGLTKGGIYSIDWVDNESFLIASADGSLRIVNVESGEVINEWTLESKVENQFLGCIVAGEFIVGVTLGGVIYLYKIGTKEPVQIIYGHQGSITALTQKETGEVISGSFDGTVLQWKNSVATLVEGDKHKGLIVQITNSKNDKTFTVSWDDTLNFIEDDKSKKLVSFEKQPLDLKSVNEQLYVLFEDELSIYKESGELIKSHKLIYDASSIDVSSKFIVITDARSFKVNIYDKDFKLLNDSNVLRGKPVLTKISPDESYIASGDASGKILLYSLGDFSLVTSRWAFHTSKINSISWHPSNKYIVSGSLDTNVIIFSVEKPARTIKYLNAHKEGVNVVEWENESSIITAGSDAVIKYWDVKFE